MNSYFFKINEKEKSDILNQHKNVYNGWIMQTQQGNTTPLFVEDLAKDKSGFTLTNEEAVDMCEQCNESECPECGGVMKEEICEQCGYKTKDIDTDSEFDYTETKMNESAIKIKQFMNRMKIL